jgi:hypothetical protein
MVQRSTQTSDPICVSVQREPKYASALLRLSPRPKSAPRRSYNRFAGGERRGKRTRRVAVGEICIELGFAGMDPSAPPPRPPGSPLAAIARSRWPPWSTGQPAPRRRIPSPAAQLLPLARSTLRLLPASQLLDGQELVSFLPPHSLPHLLSLVQIWLDPLLILIVAAVGCLRAGRGCCERIVQWTEVISWEPRAFVYHNFLVSNAMPMPPPRYLCLCMRSKLE